MLVEIPAGKQSRGPRVKCLTNGELWQDEAQCAVRVPHPTAAHGKSAAAEGYPHSLLRWVLLFFAPLWGRGVCDPGVAQPV